MGKEIEKKIEKENKYLYALDLGMSSSGIAIFNISDIEEIEEVKDIEEMIEKFEVVHLTSIQTRDKDSHGLRLHKVREQLKALIDIYPPFEIAIERSFTRFNKSTQVLYRVHGVVNELFYDKVQYYYSPSEVKKFLTGKGNANKEIVNLVVSKLYPKLRIKNLDESDAIAIGITHICFDILPSHLYGRGFLLQRL